MFVRWSSAVTRWFVAHFAMLLDVVVDKMMLDQRRLGRQLAVPSTRSSQQEHCFESSITFSIFNPALWFVSEVEKSAFGESSDVVLISLGILGEDF